MYVYYKSADVYRVMLLLADFAAKPYKRRHESLPLSATVIKFIGLRFSQDFVLISARLGFNHGVLYKYFNVGSTY